MRAELCQLSCSSSEYATFRTPPLCAKQAATKHHMPIDTSYTSHKHSLNKISILQILKLLIRAWKFTGHISALQQS